MDGIDLLRRSPFLPLDVLLISAGVMAQPCLDAAATLERHGLGVTVADPRWITPVNPTLTQLAARHQLVVTIEDSSRTGGIGTATRAACVDAAVTTPVRTLGLPSAFLDHADRPTLLTSAGLDGHGIARAVLDITSGRAS
jgi:1-deoxy-D-xylulose-5-phosphate synthase